MNLSVVSSKPCNLPALTYTVAVEQKTNTKWTAKALGWTDCWAEGRTRLEALENLEKMIVEQLAKAEIVQMEIPLPKPENPLLALAGKYKDDPDFDDVVAAIQDYRREIDAATNDGDEVAQ